MNNAEARKWLDGAWNRVLETGTGEPDGEIDRLVNSGVLSIRYAIMTQMLGKIADGNRSLLSLQLGTGESPGAWDARSFCTSVIVPWVADNHAVLGKSPDPYVNNPLRRPRLDEGTHQLRNKEEWDALVEFLAPLDAGGRIKLEAAFIRCLESVARRLAAQSFEYQIPIRVSLPQILETLSRDGCDDGRPRTCLLSLCECLVARAERSGLLHGRAGRRDVPRRQRQHASGYRGQGSCLDIGGCQGLDAKGPGINRSVEQPAVCGTKHPGR